MKLRASTLLAVPLLAAAAPAPAQETGPALVVLNKSDDEAVVVDPTTYRVVAALPTGAAPHEVAVSPDGGRAYVTDYGTADEPGNTVTVLDLVDRAVVGTWDLGTYTRPHGVAVSRDGNVVWVTAEGARAVLELDAGTGEIRRVWRTDESVSHMVAPTPDERKLYVANIGSGTVSVVDRAAGTVTTVETGAGAEGIAVSPDGGEAWVTNREANTVSILDVATDEVVAEIESGGEMPIRVKFTPDGREAWVSNARSDAVAVFRVADRALVDVLEVGAVPVGILVSPDGRRAFVANTRDDRVTVFDVPNRSRLTAFAPGDEPDGMAWSPAARLEPVAGGEAGAGSAPVAADPADVGSIDAILAALYDVISGPAGERDWDRFRSLFVPGARLVPAAPRADGGGLRALGVEDYVRGAGAYFRENAFWERESGREVERFGNVASVMSAYESRREAGGEPFARGINAITLAHDGERWWVVSIAWDEAREGNPLPEGYGGG